MNTRIIGFIIAAVGFVVSLWLGVAIAQSEWETLSVFAVGILGIFFISAGYRFTFIIVVFLVTIGGRFYAGFALSRDEQFLILSGALVAATFWKQQTGILLPFQFRSTSFSAAKVLLITWIFYGAIHMAIHLTLFQRIGFQNILKSYNSTLTPCIFLLYFFLRPEMFPIPKRYFHVFSWIIAITTSLSVMMRVYQTYFGSAMEAESPDDVGLAGPLIINFLRFGENQYNLRGLAPSAALLGAIILTSRMSSLRNGFWRLFGFGLLGVSFVGALYSGGRAGLIVALGLCAFVLFIRRQRGPLFIGAIFGVLLIVFANLFSGWINTRAPMQVARSAQMILVEKDASTSKTISGSSEWRWGLAMYALKAWQKDPKTIALGLGFQGISSSDITAANSSFGKSEEFSWEMGVKRVSTHNLVTDLLVGYGLIGAIIYYPMLIALIFFTARVYRRLPNESPHKDFALFTLALLLVASILGNVAGTFLPINNILYLIILVTALAQFPPIVKPSLSLQSPDTK